MNTPAIIQPSFPCAIDRLRSLSLCCSCNSRMIQRPGSKRLNGESRLARSQVAGNRVPIRNRLDKAYGVTGKRAIHSPGIAPFGAPPLVLDTGEPHIEIVEFCQRDLDILKCRQMLSIKLNSKPRFDHGQTCWTAKTKMQAI